MVSGNISFKRKFLYRYTHFSSMNKRKIVEKLLIANDSSNILLLLCFANAVFFIAWIHSYSVFSIRLNKLSTNILNSEYFFFLFQFVFVIKCIYLLTVNKIQLIHEIIVIHYIKAYKWNKTIDSTSISIKFRFSFSIFVPVQSNRNLLSLLTIDLLWIKK